MKKSTLFISIMILFALLFAVAACDSYYEDDGYWEDEEGYYNDEYTDEEYSDDDYSSSNGGNDGSVAFVVQDLSSDCMNGESYHSDSGLCYLDGDQAIPLFAALMDGVTDYVDVEEKLLDDEYILVTYAVNGDEISSPSYENVSSNLASYQNDTGTQDSIWQYYTAMIPADARELLVGYKIVTDGQGGTLAMVEQSEDDPARWLLTVDIADTKDLRDLTYTLIHEYGHLLTLNENQIDINEEVFYNQDDDDLYYAAEENCSTYFPGEGCAKSSSYIYQFYREFWTDIYNEWSEINYIEDDDAYYEALDNFYNNYQDRFVTDYAATNVGEDIAESWAFFIISEKPAGNTIAEQKILFFYQFPELVALREEIAARTYSRMTRMQ